MSDTYTNITRTRSGAYRLEFFSTLTGKPTGGSSLKAMTDNHHRFWEDIFRRLNEGRESADPEVTTTRLEPWMLESISGSRTRKDSGESEQRETICARAWLLAPSLDDRVLSSYATTYTQLGHEHV
jgi:hypothetical protein